jgi:hypothetical protein
MSRARAVALARSEEARLVLTIAADSIAGRVRTGLYERFNARVLVNLASHFRVQALNSKQLQALLGAPAMVAGKVAMLSQEADVRREAAEAVVAVAAAGAGAAGTATMVSQSILVGTTATWLGVGSGSLSTAAGGAALAGGAVLTGVVVAGAGGYVVGSEVNDLITLTNPSFRGQSDYTLGDAIYDFFEDDDDGGEGASGEAEPDAAGEEDDASEAEPDAAGEEDDASGEEDDDTDDDGEEDDDGEDDDSSSEDDAGGDDDSGTTLNPEAEIGSAIDTLLFYMATGLGRGEVQRQLMAFDIQAGGALGVNRERATDLHWDRMLGGLYLRTILRGLEARRNKTGLREPANTFVALPDWRVFINGVVCPSPMMNLAAIDGIAAVVS